MQTEEVSFPIHDENCQHGLTIVEILADFYSFVGLASGVMSTIVSMKCVCGNRWKYSWWKLSILNLSQLLSKNNWTQQLLTSPTNYALKSWFTLKKLNSIFLQFLLHIAEGLSARSSWRWRRRGMVETKAILLLHIFYTSFLLFNEKQRKFACLGK